VLLVHELAVVVELYHHRELQRFHHHLEPNQEEFVDTCRSNCDPLDDQAVSESLPCCLLMIHSDSINTNTNTNIVSLDMCVCVCVTYEFEQRYEEVFVVKNRAH
jgi:hypothetical protein